MSIKVMTTTEALAAVEAKKYPNQTTYLAMYSSWFGGIVKKPGVMLVPIDDHIVHRGDGVFEAFKIIDGMIFLLDAHLDRLENSAGLIGIPMPFARKEMVNIFKETIKSAGVTNALLRLYISRGPGGFTTNPYESVGSQMYFVVTELKNLAAEKFEKGVSIGKSAVAPKDPWFARIKSCNYLPNVLMKKESVDRKLDFTVSFDDKGVLTESSTENIAILNKQNELIRPTLNQILKGTTMMRTFELAQSLVASKSIAGIKEGNISEQDIIQAKEVFMIGTTLDVLPVTSYEGKAIGGGAVGPVAKELLKLLREDIKKGPMSVPL
jgi:Branched-chain amino acid aminotransferase/4-amino-4-deoxychorismate lyase